MPNKSLFQTYRGKTATPTTTVNDAGGKAYERSKRDALTLYALTGTFNGTYYVDDKTHLERVIDLCNEVEKEADGATYILKLAKYSRVQGFMKDMPAALLAWLVCNGHAPIVEPHFQTIVDNVRVLRTFVQMVRSGAFGRKSFGTVTKRMIVQWLRSKSPNQLFRSSVGNSPSLADVIKMVHPKAPIGDEQWNQTVKYLLDKPYEYEQLPSLVQQFHTFKQMPNDLVVPDVPFEMLTGLSLDNQTWTNIARNMSWTQLRMNLNTLKRHEVFENPELVMLVADRLKNVEAIQKSKVFPYQIFAAYKNAINVPESIRASLREAVKVALKNVPVIEGRVAICVDVSGSMSSPITGKNGVSSMMRCVDVAALFAAALREINPNTRILAFDYASDGSNFWGRSKSSNGLYPLTDEDATKSLFDLADALSKYGGGGGTDCTLPLKLFNKDDQKFDLVIYISDNESWGSYQGGRYRFTQGTGMQAEWNAYKSRNPKAKLVCIDITPSTTSQVETSQDVLMVGGFNDNVFTVINEFVKNNTNTLASYVDAML